MNNLIPALGLCLGAAACSPQPAGAAALPSSVAGAPQLTPVRPGGLYAVCYPIYHGGVWCRPARRVAWVPGRSSCNRMWVPGHWG